MNRFSFGLMVCSLGAGVILFSCANESPWQSGTKGEGVINLNLSAHNDITAAVPAVRAISDEVVKPPVEEFKIRISKDDGTYSQTFSSTEEFGKNESFPVGNYEIEAWYGNPNSQGFVKDDEIGYEHAYYYSKTGEVVVQEARTTEVNLQCSLANSIIVIEYTDAFKNYFKNWSTIVQTDGNEIINLGGLEGTSYVISGDVSITIDAELQNGKKVKLNPGGFEMKPQHMYKLRYNIYNGEVGHSQLAIEFDENLNEKPILVDLSEDLELTPVPVISPEGFKNKESIVNQSGTPYEGSVIFNVEAKGGIKEAFLTISSPEKFKPSFLTNGKVDLCKISKEELEKEGIKAIGFSENASEYAKLDLSELCRNLPDGTYKFSLQVNDRYTQASDPVEVTLTCMPIKMSITADPAPFGEGYAEITISYDGPDPTIEGQNPFIFETENSYGSYSECKIIEPISIIGPTKDVPNSFDYLYRISIPEINKDEFIIRCYLNEVTDNGTYFPVKVPFTYPEYKVELDPMTKKLRLRVPNDNAKKKALFFHKLNVLLDDVLLPLWDKKQTTKPAYLRDEPSGLIVVYNLTPNKSYKVKTTLESNNKPSSFGSEDEITTTPEYVVPNTEVYTESNVVKSRFVSTVNTINETLNVGAPFEIAVTFIKDTYNTKCHFNYNEPKGGWSSINSKTFYINSKVKNSWFMVASTYLENDSVVIRTVGYNHDGTLPAKTSSLTTYYNPHAPGYDEFTRCSGEFFLGSYDGESDERDEGVEFHGRPTSLSFNYTYHPLSDDSKGSVEIKIYDNNGKEISSGKVNLDEPTRHKTEKERVFLSRYPFGSEAAKLSIKFLSSDMKADAIDIHIPKDAELDEGLTSTNFRNVTIGENSAHAIAIGSILKITNLKFNYGEKQDD